MEQIQFILQELKNIDKSSLTHEDLKIMVAIQMWENKQRLESRKNIHEIREILKMQ